MYNNSEVIEKATELYQENLWNNPEVLNYLIKERILSEAVLKEFKVGYASNHLLYNTANRQGWLEDAIHSKLVSNNYDFMEGYITFPIFSPSLNKYYNIYGRAFGDTTLPHKVVIEKSQPYNPDALNREAVILVESPIDALTLIQHKFNTIAVMGSKIPDSTKHLFKNKSCYIVFDTDFAGKNGAIRTAEILQGIAKHIFIVTFPARRWYKQDANLYFIRIENPVLRMKFLLKNSVPILPDQFPKKAKKQKKYEEDDLDIVEVGRVLFAGLDIQDKGMELWLKCPHHKEGTEANRSLWVGGNKNIFNCFGCNTGGGPVAMVMWHLGLKLDDAIQWLRKYFPQDN